MKTAINTLLLFLLLLNLAFHLHAGSAKLMDLQIKDDSFSLRVADVIQYQI